MRTTTSPASRSSSVKSTNSARTFLSASVSRYALNVCTAPPAFALQVSLGLHLVQPAYRSLEFGAVVPLRKEPFRRGLGRYHQLHPVIVEHIDQPSEAPR